MTESRRDEGIRGKSRIEKRRPAEGRRWTALALHLSTGWDIARRLDAGFRHPFRDSVTRRYESKVPSGPGKSLRDAALELRIPSIAASQSVSGREAASRIKALAAALQKTLRHLGNRPFNFPFFGNEGHPNGAVLPPAFRSSRPLLRSACLSRWWRTRRGAGTVDSS